MSWPQLKVALKQFCCDRLAIIIKMALSCFEYSVKYYIATHLIRSQKKIGTDTAPPALEAPNRQDTRRRTVAFTIDCARSHDRNRFDVGISCLLVLL